MCQIDDTFDLLVGLDIQFLIVLSSDSDILNFSSRLFCNLDHAFDTRDSNLPKVSDSLS